MYSNITGYQYIKIFGCHRKGKKEAKMADEPKQWIHECYGCIVHGSISQKRSLGYSKGIYCGNLILHFFILSLSLSLSLSYSPTAMHYISTVIDVGIVPDDVRYNNYCWTGGDGCIGCAMVYGTSTQLADPASLFLFVVVVLPTRRRVHRLSHPFSQQRSVLHQYVQHNSSNAMSLLFGGAEDACSVDYSSAIM